MRLGILPAFASFRIPVPGARTRLISSNLFALWYLAIQFHFRTLPAPFPFRSLGISRRFER